MDIKVTEVYKNGNQKIYLFDGSTPCFIYDGLSEDEAKDILKLEYIAEKKANTTKYVPDEIYEAEADIFLMMPWVAITK